MTDYDFEIMAKTIYGEARGESRQGQTPLPALFLTDLGRENGLRRKRWPAFA